MRFLKRRALGLAVVVVLHGILAGASPPLAKAGGSSGRPSTRTKMKIYDALKIAVDLLEKQKLMYRPEYKLRAARVKDEWVFWFVFLPETPGLDVTVFVSDSGETRILPGM